jgi:hypothetical protein
VLDPSGDHLPVDVKAVSNTWSMAKDGKHYFSPVRQVAIAKRIADRTTKTSIEAKALAIRLIAKWRGK